MKIIGINGSPRKSKNTAILLKSALDGAVSAGAEAKLYHLFDYKFQGCVSCLACKRKGAEIDPHCALNDDLTPILKEIATADALVMGSPIYFYGETGAFRSCMERLLFPYYSYATGQAPRFKGKLNCAVIYTMNMGESHMFGNRPGRPEWLKLDILKTTPLFFQGIFGNCEYLCSNDTMQVDDYSKYDMTAYNAEAKQKRHLEVFPLDCAKAFELGKNLIK